jgi:hypothetical protein
MGDNWRQIIKRIFPPAAAAVECGREVRKTLDGIALKAKSRHAIFSNYYKTNKWGDLESRSGCGSNLQVTQTLREALPSFLRDHQIQSMLDAPCGDFNWMKDVDLRGIDYIGVDIVPAVIEDNARRYGTPRREFKVIDLCVGSLPKVDLILCRDGLVHLSDEDALEVVRQFKESGSTYLLATTFPARDSNNNIATGMWRPLNLRRKPFCFPEPILIFNEGYTGQQGRYADKSLALWRIADIPGSSTGPH